jgi:hypothetical protein
MQDAGWLVEYVITHGKKWHVFSLSGHTFHARCSAYARYFNRTLDVYVAFAGISIVLTYQWLAINLIVQSKQLFARRSVLLNSRFAVRDRTVLHSQHTYQPIPKNKRTVPILPKKEKTMRWRM